MKKIFTAITVVIAMSCATVYLFGGQLIIGYISSASGLRISYSSAESMRINRIALAGFVVSDRREALALSAEKALFEPEGGLKGLLRESVKFSLRQVRFSKNGNARIDYGSLEALVAAPFDSQWRYEEISGSVERIPGGMHIERIDANGSEIRLSISGEVYSNNRVDLNIKIYFGQRIVNDVPKELAGVLLSPEEGGWRSLSVNLKGDYRKPSINVSSKLFRLNIKSVAS